MKIYTSYFYQIRNFKSNMIPVSTCLSDPAWFKPPMGKEYYIDKRGIICGLRYEPLMVQSQGSHYCPCENKEILQGQCDILKEYRQLLETVDFNRVIKGFQFCANKFQRPFDKEEPIIVLMVYETPSNPCSERIALQDYFTSHGWKSKELNYPIK